MANSSFSSLLGSGHISIQTLTEFIDGQLDQVANNFYANASHISVGNSSLATVITSNNVTTQTLTIGDENSNVSVNSTAFNLNSYGATNTYIDAYQAIFSGVITASRGMIINGSLIDPFNNPGNSGDILMASGPGLYWTSAANNTLYLGGIAANQYAYANALPSYQTLAGLSSNVITLVANNTTYVGNVLAGDVVSGFQLSANLANYQTNVDLSANVLTLTSNNTTYVGTVTAANVVSNAQLIANLANYQTTAGFSSNVLTLTANNTTYVGTVTAANVVSNAQLQSNLANYQTTVGLAANVFTLIANNATYVGSVTAANVVSNAQLQSNLANYQTTAGLAANVALLDANNAFYLGNVSYTSYANRFTNNTISGFYTYTTNVNINDTIIANNVLANQAVVNTFTVGKLYANQFSGANGLVLTSNGTGTYWSDITNVSGGIFDGGNPFSSYINSPRLDAGGVY